MSETIINLIGKLKYRDKKKEAEMMGTMEGSALFNALVDYWQRQTDIFNIERNAELRKTKPWLFLEDDPTWKREQAADYSLFIITEDMWHEAFPKSNDLRFISAGLDERIRLEYIAGMPFSLWSDREKVKFEREGIPPECDGAISKLFQRKYPRLTSGLK